MTRHSWVRNSLLLVGFLAAAISVGRGCYNALVYSQDFSMRWISARILTHGENPYQMMLQGKLSDYASELLTSNQRMNFVPDYFPSALLPVFPLCTLPFEVAAIVWLMANLLSIVVLIWIAHRFARHLEQAKPLYTVLAACLLLTGTPLRNIIGVGQLGLISMAAFMLSLVLHQQGRWIPSGVFLAISLIKYTLIGPFVFFRFLVNRAWRPLALATAIHVIVHLLICFNIDAHPIWIFFDILRLNADVLANDSLINVWMLGRHIHAVLPLMPDKLLGCLLLVVLIAIITHLWRHTNNQRTWLAWIGLLGLMTMLSVPNKSYNNFFLFFPALWLIAEKGPWWPRGLAGASIVYFFFIQKQLLEQQLPFTGLETLIPVFDAIFYITVLGSLIILVRSASGKSISRSANPPSTL